MTRATRLGRLLLWVSVLLAGLIGSAATAAAADQAQAVPQAIAPTPRDVALVGASDPGPLVPPPLDFERIDRGWLTVECPASVRARIEALARDADSFRTRLSDDLGQPVLAHVLVRVGRTPEQMNGLAPRAAPPPPYATGVAYPATRLVLLALQAPDTWEAPDVGEVLRHELTHVALYEAAGGQRLPRWFDEGVAIHESGELYLNRWTELWNASMSGRLLPLAALDDGFPDGRSEVSVAYAESADVVRFLMRGGDRARFGSLVERTRQGTSFDRALEDAYGTDVRTLEYEWREDVSHRFGWIPAVTGGGVLWVVIAALSAAAWVKMRQRSRVKLAEWASEEAAAAEAARRAAEAQPPEPQPSGAKPRIDNTPPRRIAPIVEHEGRWYTLH